MVIELDCGENSLIGPQIIFPDEARLRLLSLPIEHSVIVYKNNHT